MAYQRANVAVDVAIFTIRDKQLSVLLHTREKEPFTGRPELPGGLLQENESAEEAVIRKLEETLGTSDLYTEQFHTFSDPRRDPRTRTITIGHVALIHKTKLAGDLTWTSFDTLPKLAFDHNDILIAAREALRRPGTTLLKQFLPDAFPLNHLQTVIEALEGQTYDNRNFRKKWLSSGQLKDTGTREKGVSHRPASLYAFA